jgi:hypothetical protein
MKPTLVVGLGLMLAPAPAAAQDAAPNDPKAGTPSGTVYEIPFEAGRNDAAPRRRPSDPGAAEVDTSGGSSPTGGSTPIRSSDNGFGSSSVVPGASSGGSERGGKSGAKGRAAGRRKGASGAGVTDPGSAEALIRPASAANPAGPGTPSLTRALLLLALGVVVAVALGVGARRSSRGR